MACVYIGLGSNLGDRANNIKFAKELLSQFYSADILNESCVEETDPVDFLKQPKFLNQVIQIKTEMNPLSLLKILKDIEQKLGREKTFLKGPRIIDMDILLYDSLIMETEELIIPHAEIRNRPFVMKHLLELDPHLEDPLTKVKYSRIYAEKK